MALPDPDGLDALPLSELRGLVADLIGQVRALTDENRALRDEVARLKGLPPRPPSRTLAGMEKATQRRRPARPARRSRRLPRTGPGCALTAEVVLAASVPGGSRFKGYQDILIRDLRSFGRGRAPLPAGALGDTIGGDAVVAPLPSGIAGGFGPALRRFIPRRACPRSGDDPRLLAPPTGIGVAISKRQVVRLLTGSLERFIEEDHAVLRAGLAHGPLDHGGRYGGAAWPRSDGFTTQALGNVRFTAFRTGPSKSRQAFLSLLRAGQTGYVINDAALGVMRGLSLAGPLSGAACGPSSEAVRR